MEQRNTDVGAPLGRQVSPTVTRLALAGVMAAVIAVFSLISIPIGTVPLTLQTLAVLVAGGLLGPLWGPVSVAVYLLVGLMGVPVFAGGEAGLHVLLGPKGGYLVGFVVAAFIMGLAGRAARARGLASRAALAVADRRRRRRERGDLPGRRALAGRRRRVVARQGLRRRAARPSWSATRSRPPSRSSSCARWVRRSTARVCI